MGTAGQEAGCQARCSHPWPGPPRAAAARTVQAARGAERVQHLLTPLGEAVLGPGDALQQLQQLLLLLRLLASRPARQVAVGVTEQGEEGQVSALLPPPTGAHRSPRGARTHLRDGLLRLFFRPRLRARLPLLFRVSSQSPRLPLPLLPPLLSGPPHSGPASDTHWFRGAVPRPPSCYKWQAVRGAQPTAPQKARRGGLGGKGQGTR